MGVGAPAAGAGDRARLGGGPPVVPGNPIGSCGLDRAETSVVVRFHGDEVVTTDGPYEREEEHAGGICVVAAPDYDAAIEWGRRLARATTLPVEVREFQGEPGAHLP